MSAVYVQTSCTLATGYRVVDALISVIVAAGSCAKADHFRKDQTYDPPMTHAMLLTNIENGVPVEGGDRILQREHQRVQVLAELAGTGPGDSAPVTGSAAISVHGSVDETEK
eukprot:6485444-Amphidinium_carterae.1